MELRQLEALRAVAETGGFHTAAERLGLTQPAVSHQIRKLEEAIGEPLVVRARPSAYLSPAGEAVLASAERILGEVERLKARFGQTGEDSVSGTLRVAVTTLGIVYLYSDMLEEFIAHNPGIELVLTVTETHLDGAKLVLARKADLAFAAFPLELGNLDYRTLGEAENVVIVSHTHPLAVKGRVSARRLLGYPFIRYQTGSGSRRVSDQYFLSQGGYPPILLESNDTEFIKRIVGLGLGTAIVPAFTAAAGRHDERLKLLRFAEGPIMQEFGMVQRRDGRGRAVDLFSGFCASRSMGVLAPDAA